MSVKDDKVYPLRRCHDVKRCAACLLKGHFKNQCCKTVRFCLRWEIILFFKKEEKAKDTIPDALFLISFR